MVLFLHCSNNNRADTVFDYFKGAIDEYGLPSRVRTDKGRENTEIAWFMLNNRGPDRGSHIAGRSVHNQRTERLWRDVFTGCTSSFYDVFNRMEAQNILDPDNELHLFCLHFVILPRINQSLETFMHAFNQAPIRTMQH